MTQEAYKENGWIVEVDITHRCNLRCRHCNRLCNAETHYNTHRDLLDMDERHINYLCSQIRKQQAGKIRMLRILGGEPLLSPIIRYAIESFESLRTEGLIQDIVVMSNGTVKVPEYLEPYIIHYPPKIQNVISNNGKITTNEVYSIKEEKHVNITFSPADNDCFIDKPCDRYIGCGVHYSVYGFSLCASCFPSMFVFQRNHGRFLHHLPSSIDSFIDERFTKEVCSFCVYGLRLMGLNTDTLAKEGMGNRWEMEVGFNRNNGFKEPDTSWINMI